MWCMPTSCIFRISHSWGSSPIASWNLGNWKACKGEGEDEHNPPRIRWVLFERIINWKTATKQPQALCRTQGSALWTCHAHKRKCKIMRPPCRKNTYCWSGTGALGDIVIKWVDFQLCFCPSCAAAPVISRMEEERQEQSRRSRGIPSQKLQTTLALVPFT